MSNPTDKPDFKKIASTIMLGVLSEKDVEVLLSSLYEQGYHVGLIYGWGIEQDKDYLAKLKDREQAIRQTNANDELRELEIVSELSEILGKPTMSRYTSENEPDPFETL